MTFALTKPAAALLAAAALSAAAPASAALITYDIVDGTLATLPFSGQLSYYDDLPPSGSTVDGAPVYALHSFSFQHGATSFSTADLPADPAMGWAVPQVGSLPGLDLSFAPYTFVPGAAAGLFDPVLIFFDGNTFDEVTITYRQVITQDVPEPASLALALTALLGLGAARRAQRRG